MNILLSFVIHQAYSPVCWFFCVDKFAQMKI